MDIDYHEIMKHHNPPPRPAQSIRANARRGFSRIRVKGLAGALQSWELNKSQLKNHPKAIKDIFDILNKKWDIEYPTRFSEYIKEFEQIPFENKRLCLAAPPQFGKSMTSLISLGWLCLTWPSKKHMYITYNDTRAQDVKDEFCSFLDKLGVIYMQTKGVVKIRSLKASDKSFQKYDVNVKFVGIEGGITGYPIDGLVILDDILKDKEEALSPTIKRKRWQAFQQNISTRRNANFSVINIQTRWATDDITGRLLKLKDADGNKIYKYINFKAINNNGESLWPEKRPLKDLLEQKELLGSAFEAMYQGNPISDDLKPLPLNKLTITNKKPNIKIEAVGVDCAYTTAGGDWSVGIKLGWDGNNFWVLDFIRQQVLYEEFLIGANKKWKSIKGLWYCSPMEHKVVAPTIKAKYPALRSASTNKPKIIRADNLKAAWNNNKFYINEQVANRASLIFDDIDVWNGYDHNGSDTVDALVAAYDLLKVLIKKGPKVVKKKENIPDQKWLGGNTRGRKF